MTEILIDLDRPDPRPPEDRERRRWSGPTPFQLRVLLVVAALLVTAFGVGASAAPRPPRFGGPVRIPGTGADEFLLAGSEVRISFSEAAPAPDGNGRYMVVEEGTFQNGQWVLKRRWNGDQLDHGLNLTKPTLLKVRFGFAR